MVRGAAVDRAEPGSRAGARTAADHGWQIVSMDIPLSETNNVLLGSSMAIDAAREDQRQNFPVKVFWSIH